MDDYRFSPGLTELPKDKLPPLCPKCGYNMTGLPSHRCPECGNYATVSDLERGRRKVRELVSQVETVNDYLRVGYITGPSGLVLFFILRLYGFSGLDRLLAIFVGLATAGMGVQVFRVKGIPRRLSGLVSVRPNYVAGSFVAVVGLLLVLLGIVLPG